MPGPTDERIEAADKRREAEDVRAYPADTMRERRGESAATQWFLVAGNRFAVAGLFLLSTVALLYLLGRIGPGTPRQLLSSTVLASVFGSVIIVIVTGGTLVLTITQLVLSRELGALGEKRSEMSDEMEFRADVAERSSVSVGPPEPSAFVRALLDATGEAAADLADSLDGADAEIRPQLRTFAEETRDHSETTNDRLAPAEFGTVEMMIPVFDYNYSWKLYAARYFLERHEGRLGTARAPLERLTELLSLFGPAREYLKTKYFQWDAISLARTTLYAAIPALSIAVYAMLWFDPQQITGATLGVNNAYLSASVMFALSIAPFALLLSYVLRIVTLARRTLAIGPFILRRTDPDRE